MAVELILAALVCATLVMSVWRHGLVSFVTLGVIGAAIYAVPGIVDVEQSFNWSARARFQPTADDADAVVAAAWCGLLAGIALFSAAPPQLLKGAPQGKRSTMHRLALASAMLASLGLLYLFATQGLGILAASRAEQKSDAVLYLWRWTAPLGLIASILSGSRKLLYFHLAILAVVFLRGDRTLIAISAAAVLAAALQGKPWLRLFKPSYVAGCSIACVGIFFGKSLFLNIKAWLVEKSSVTQGVTAVDQLYYQFEPLATYSHIGFVVRRDLEIPFLDFLQSLAANLLFVPSSFGLSTNIYGELIQRTAAERVDTGLAGNYIANGYVVAGIAGAAVFYFIFALVLRICNTQFLKTTGVWKLFWGCTGATFAFYVHRNGLDNMMSFVRQIAIVCVMLAALAVILSFATRRRLQRNVYQFRT